MTGYPSKKKAAQDKLKCQCSMTTKLVGSGCQYCNPEYLDDDDDTQVYQDDTLTIAYQSGYYDGKKASQPAQEPVAYLCGPDKNGLFNLPTADKACKDCFPVYTAPPQPKQEPVANDRALQLVTYQMNHWRAYALELQERLVKYEGGAPMLLNKENT